ncbi:unnamed protein product [Mycena citricolor]|uniref:Uncharacterized protein n=1 Tax=Mycena citricolor TaxID=2018698 RepID=A0AAD2HGS7_9AGAR|nr:unnamed protein product [Mycena citricolor]
MLKTTLEYNPNLQPYTLWRLLFEAASMKGGFCLIFSCAHVQRRLRRFGMWCYTGQATGATWIVSQTIPRSGDTTSSDHLKTQSLSECKTQELYISCT